MRRVWLDLGQPAAFVTPAGPLERWQDHGLGLLRTLLQRHGVSTHVLSVRSFRSWRRLARKLGAYDMLLMNVRSQTLPIARRAARIFKQQRRNGIVIVGGVHASVAPGEMDSISEFDRICSGSGEGSIVDVVRNSGDFPRIFEGVGFRSMAEWPMIDRTLWPRPGLRGDPWPLEPACGWGPAPVATVLTSRVCPWSCAFCNECSYVPAATRKPVEMVIDELNTLDRLHGPVGSVVIHDSMFFQQPAWLQEWLEKYPRRARRRWPYWAAARADGARRWPDLFEALVRETNWSTISIGFESGSDRVLRILNKGCSAEDNRFAIELLNRIGDRCRAEGRAPPRFWANLMLGVPGESREDAFATMRMLEDMRYAIPSVAFFAPYPGSALGNQIIGEGRSLLTDDGYDRHPGVEKVAGIDYAFYRDLLRGRYADEIKRAGWPRRRSSDGDTDAGLGRPSRGLGFYLFEMRNGRKKLAYGADPGAALATLALRLDEDEMSQILRNRWVRIPQRDLQRRASELG